ncbi:MAG: hypothetical protein IJT77_13490 [Clostridia bacterium]|nr:hypothetical protein [Clostridia bacterium]
MRTYYFGDHGSILMKEHGKYWIFSYYHLHFIDASFLGDLDMSEWQEVPVSEVKARLEDGLGTAIQNHEKKTIKKYTDAINHL